MRSRRATASTRATSPSRGSPGSGTARRSRAGGSSAAPGALTDKAAVSDLPFKTEDWLLCEVLSDRGETVVLEPAAMRETVAARAAELLTEMKLDEARPEAHGRTSLNVEPAPGSDTSSTRPPWASATARTTASPMPDPGRASVRRTPASNTRA